MQGVTEWQNSGYMTQNIQLKNMYVALGFSSLTLAGHSCYCMRCYGGFKTLGLTVAFRQIHLYFQIGNRLTQYCLLNNTSFYSESENLPLSYINSLDNIRLMVIL